MGYWSKDGSYVRDASDYTPQMTQGDIWAAEQRVIKGMQDWAEQEKRRRKQSRAEYYEIRKKIEDERSEAIQYEYNRRKAVMIIVKQKRQEYNKKSWFGKGIAKLRGKTFVKMRNEIEDYAYEKVENMSSQELERFIENNSEKGRAR